MGSCTNIFEPSLCKYSLEFSENSYFKLSYHDQTAEKAQQAFSSSAIPTLCNAVPALEKLYMTWEKQRDQPESIPFQDAIDAAMTKINEYYEKSAESDAHIMAMSEY